MSHFSLNFLNSESKVNSKQVELEIRTVYMANWREKMSYD